MATPFSLERLASKVDLAGKKQDKLISTKEQMKQLSIYLIYLIVCKNMLKRNWNISRQIRKIG